MSSLTPSKYQSGDPVMILGANGEILSELARITQVLPLETSPDGKQYYCLDTGSPTGWPETGLDFVKNLSLALELATRGWYVFPCHEAPWTDHKGKPRNQKEPYYNRQDLPHGKDNATPDPDLIRRWWGAWPNALIGIYCEKSGFFAVDLDRKPGAPDGVQSWAELVETYGGGASIPAGPIQQTPSGGNHVLFELPQDLKIPNNAGKLAPGIDLRSAGYICTGGPYTWLDDHGPETQLTPAPAWLLDLIRKMTDRPRAHELQPQPAGVVSGNDPGAYWLDYYLQRAAPGCRNQAGFELACQLRDSGLLEIEAAAIMETYAARVPGADYSEREALASLQSAYHAPRREAAHLPGLTSRRNGHGPTPTPPDEFEGWPAETEPAEPGRPTQGSLTDTGNAERLKALHGDNLRFVKAWGWLAWTGKRWEIDEKDLIVKLAKDTARAIFSEAARAGDDERAKALASWGGKSLNRTRLEAMIALAKSELPAMTEDFDRNPWALNVNNGIIDLQTGKLQPHNRRAMLTKISGVDYDPAARCPTWERFLSEVFDGNQELIDFIQRAVGYSLTGDTSEQVFFFLHGLGANGKSTFANVINDLLADYAMKARAEVLMIRRFDPISEETAQIAGVRFLLAAELGEGQRLNEPLIKDLTGGDKLRARLLYHKSFEFYPAAKVWLYGNHKPSIHGSDEGIWRRPKLIPFTVTFPEGKRDKRLPEKLRAELPGVLAWAVRGCLEWQRIGLKPPAAVTMATADFRAEQDILGQFLTDNCLINSLASVTAGELYKTYKSWAEDSGLKVLSSQVFSRQLSERGFSTTGQDGKPRRDANGRAYYLGLGLLR